MIPKIPATIELVKEPGGHSIIDYYTDAKFDLKSTLKRWKVTKLDSNTYMVHAYFPKTRKLYLGLVDTIKWEKTDGD